MGGYDERGRGFSGARRVLFCGCLWVLLAVAPAAWAAGAAADGALRNWGKTFGGPEADEALSIAATADHGLVLAGLTNSFVATPGYEDAWVLKLDGAGAVAWEKAYGGELWDSLQSIKQTADGGYVAAGTRYPPDGSQEAWVLRLRPDGEVAWQYTYGRPLFYDGAWAIESTADGGFLLLGWTQSYALGGEQGAWVLKLSGAGAVEWQKFLGGSGIDHLIAGRQAADGGYLLVGGTYSYAGVPFYSDVWVVKLHADGGVDWQQTYGGDADEVAYAVDQTADGGYALACWTASFGAVEGDLWVLRIDGDGTPLWQKSYGGAGGDVPTDLQVTADGGLLVAGYTASFGAGDDDGWVLKLAANGRIEWQKSFGGAGKDQFQGVVATAEGYAAAGQTASFGAGATDAWALHFTPTGPGSSLLRQVAARSSAAARDTESATSFVAGYSRDTDVSPVPSLTATRTTAAEQGSQAVSRGGNRSPEAPAGVARGTGALAWPLLPELRGAGGAGSASP